MADNTEMTLIFTLIVACVNQLKLIIEQRRRASTLLNMMRELSETLLEKQYLISSTFFFETHSFFDALPFLIIGTQVNQPLATSGGTSFSNYHYCPSY
jgi:hypothetical protein